MQDWSLARCKGMSDLFFSETPSKVRKAKSICENCPLRRPCLMSALERSEAWGVWAGLDYKDLRLVATSLGYVPPTRKLVEHGTEAGWAWHRRQKKKDAGHVTCQDCIDAYNQSARVRVARYRKRKSM
jgi:hypothetical protein